MKKDNPEDKNKIRRKTVSSKRPDSSKKTGSGDEDLILPSERGKSKSSNQRRSSSSNPASKTRSVSASGSAGRDRKPNTNKKTRSKNASNSLKRKLKIKRRKKIIGGVVAAAIIVFAGGLGFIFASLKDVKPVNENLLDKLTHQTTTIKYANGETLSTAPTLYKKTPVPLSDMSPYLRKAIV